MKPLPSEIFKALGVETRVKIIELLKSKGSIGVNDIAEVLGITPSAVSQHLKILKHSGLVRNKRKGYSIPYSIDEITLEKCRCMMNEVCTCGCQQTGKCKDQRDNNANMETLLKYKKELEKKLQNVRKRILKVRSHNK